MDNRNQLNRRGDRQQLPGHPNAGTAGAWLAPANYGMVALVPVEESVGPDDQSAAGRPDPGLTQPSDPGSSSEAASLIRLSAQKLFAEGRANPLEWVCRSWIGDWQTHDRVTWRTTDGVWTAQLQRSPNGRRVYLYVWRNQTLVGYQDDARWHPAIARSRARPPRPEHRSLPLPLPLAV